MAERVLWADVARGLGIIMVVFSHCWRGLGDAGLISDQNLFYDVDTALYLVHMPLFFFLSGIFYFPSVNSKDTNMLIWNKIFTILYPYFLWSTVLIIVNVLTASFVNKPFSLSVLESLPLHPIGPFWFLYALFLIQGIALIVFRVLRLSSWMAVAIGLAMLTASFFVDAYVPHQILFHFIFFAAGTAFAEFVGLSPAISTKFAALCSALYLGGLAVALPNGLVFSAPALIPLSLLGVATVVGLSRVGATSRYVHRLSWLMALGRASMAIYVMHVLFTAGSRIVLVVLFGVHSVPALLAAGVVAGLIGPVIIYSVVHRLRLDPLFGFAAPRRYGAHVALFGS